MACFHQETKDGVWRVCFILGIVVSKSSNSTVLVKKPHEICCSSPSRFSSSEFACTTPPNTASTASRPNILTGWLLSATGSPWSALVSGSHFHAVFSPSMLIGIRTALAWFCYDFVTYPFGLFSSTIIAQFNPNNTNVQNIGYGVSHLPAYSRSENPCADLNSRLLSTASIFPDALLVVSSWTALAESKT